MENNVIGHLEIDGVKYYPRPSFPIGSVIATVRDFNPEDEYGGKWERFAKGRTLVGVDENDNYFETVKKEGGSKYLQKHSHTGTTSESGLHNHDIPWWLNSVGSSEHCVEGWRTKQIQGTFRTYDGGLHSHSFTTNVEGSGDGQNLQPYITVYYYVRVS